MGWKRGGVGGGVMVNKRCLYGEKGVWGEGDGKGIEGEERENR